MISWVLGSHLFCLGETDVQRPSSVIMDVMEVFVTVFCKIIRINGNVSKENEFSIESDALAPRC